MVFIDPVGTGFSRSLVGEEETKSTFFQVRGDIEYLSRIVFDWLVKNGRMAAPKYIVGDTPAQAAGMLVRTFTLEPITSAWHLRAMAHSDDPIGTAAYRRTWVGIPVWLWVGWHFGEHLGPLSRTATPGVTVTATAGVRSLTWSSGDGQTINCGVGNALQRCSHGRSAGCRFTDLRIPLPATSGSGTFTVSASTSWVVECTGGGESGNIAMPMTTSTAQVRVGELQFVNTANYGTEQPG